MKNNYILKIRLLGTAIILFAFVLVGRLYVVQIVRGEMYSEREEHQYYKPNQSDIDRGVIYFSDKDGSSISAATQRSGFIVALNPKILVDMEEAYKKINAIVLLDHDTFIAKASKSDDPYEEILKRVDEEKGRQIDDLKLKGVQLYREKWRFYPGEELGAHVLGLVGYKGDSLGGRYGLESFFEDTLRRNSDSLYTNFFTEIFSNVNHALLGGEVPEGDIVTSIEPNVEITLEREIKKITDDWHSEMTGGVIIDPATGEIYAMGAYPSFNPNSFQTEKNANVFTNPLVENVYEMGSIIKTLTMSAGLDSGAVNADTMYDDKGFGILNNKKFSNYDGKARGWVSMQEVLNQSLNTGAAFVASKIGKQKFADYMFNFGLGEKTGIDLPNEATGLVSNLKSPRDIEYANASFGQGLAMSPIATVRALSVLANGGLLTRPHVVKEIKYISGLTKDIPTETGKQVIKKESAEEITRMLVEVVDKALLGGKVKLPNYSVAAKTGTAQIANGSGYYEDRYLHSFFGYFPAYKPRFLIFLFTVNPKGAKYASETLTHPFIDMTNFLINYYEIPPDR
ncbi:MAG: penicillin-binding protein 2 [Candidatus Taylorbacteria bacterium]